MDTPVGGVSDDASATPMGTPDTAVDVHRRAVRDRPCRRYRKYARRSEIADGLLEIEYIDGARWRIGKVQPFAIRAHAEPVRDADVAHMAADPFGSIHRIQAAGGRAAIVFDHGAAPEPPAAVDAAIVESNPRDDGSGASQPLDLTVAHTVQRNATGKRRDEPLATGDQSERADAFRRFEYFQLGGCPVIAVALAPPDTGPPQQFATRVP